MSPKWEKLKLANLRTWFGQSAGGCFADFTDAHGAYRMIGAESMDALYKACAKFSERTATEIHLRQLEEDRRRALQVEEARIWTQEMARLINDQMRNREANRLRPEQPKEEEQKPPPKPKPPENPYRRKFG